MNYGPGEYIFKDELVQEINQQANQQDARVQKKDRTMTAKMIPPAMIKIQVQLLFPSAMSCSFYREYIVNPRGDRVKMTAPDPQVV